ncbi:hypothetical protein [Actinacidiphila acididurans]|uniref:Uncharacterized protein n=1 Tax=Actinacidiphila acididurans TaxID=2784346 RepID=A0ABS2TYZ0_9ACTN|nr:hypothetical protein [Actinacidiphila acididurans]MBM9508559.1 hypothetical protein [Actinacidiphila acididurans]
MPTPHGTRGGPAFGADEARVVRRAPAQAPRPSRPVAAVDPAALPRRCETLAENDVRLRLEAHMPAPRRLLTLPHPSLAEERDRKDRKDTEPEPKPGEEQQPAAPAPDKEQPPQQQPKTPEPEQPARRRTPTPAEIWPPHRRPRKPGEARSA